MSLATLYGGPNYRLKNSSAADSAAFLVVNLYRTALPFGLITKNQSEIQGRLIGLILHWGMMPVYQARANQTLTPDECPLTSVNPTVSLNDMLNIRQLSDRLGMSEPQVRRLLRAVDGVLRAYTRRDDNNAILVDQAGVAILDRAAQLKASGTPLTRLSDKLNEEMGDAAEQEHQAASVNGDKPRQPERQPESCPACLAKDELIEQLRRENERVWGRVERLEQLNEDLQQRALPGPRRGPLAWIGDLFRGAHEPSTELR